MKIVMYRDAEILWRAKFHKMYQAPQWWKSIFVKSNKIFATYRIEFSLKRGSFWWGGRVPGGNIALDQTSWLG